MKLTKGKINKWLSSARHTKKNRKEASKLVVKSSAPHFTLRHTKKPLNLANKTLSRWK